MSDDQKPGIFDKRITNGIAVIVMFVWAVSFLADVVSTSYQPSPYVHMLAAMVVGAAVGNSFIRNNGDNK